MSSYDLILDFNLSGLIQLLTHPTIKFIPRVVVWNKYVHGSNHAVRQDTWLEEYDLLLSRIIIRMETIAFSNTHYVQLVKRLNLLHRKRTCRKSKNCPWKVFINNINILGKSIQNTTFKKNVDEFIYCIVDNTYRQGFKSKNEIGHRINPLRTFYRKERKIDFKVFMTYTYYEVLDQHSKT